MALTLRAQVTESGKTYFGAAGAGAPGAQTPPVTPMGAGDLYLDTSIASGQASIYGVDNTGAAWEAAPSITLSVGDQFYDIAHNDVHREV